MNSNTPYLDVHFKTHHVSKVNFNGVEQFAVYSENNSSHSFILAMSDTAEAALAKAEETAKRLGLSGW